MSSLSTARAPRWDSLALPPSGFMPGGVTQHKLTRLLELRAVIDAMRCQQETHDPLLAWVTSQDRTANS
jgi:hypothetical protein